MRIGRRATHVGALQHGEVIYLLQVFFRLGAKRGSVFAGKQRLQMLPGQRNMEQPQRDAAVVFTPHQQRVRPAAPGLRVRNLHHRRARTPTYLRIPGHCPVENRERKCSLAVVREHHQVISPERLPEFLKLRCSLPARSCRTSFFCGNKQPWWWHICRPKAQPAAIVLANFQEIEAVPSHPLAVALDQFQHEFIHAVSCFKTKICKESPLGNFLRTGHREPQPTLGRSVYPYLRHGHRHHIVEMVQVPRPNRHAVPIRYAHHFQACCRHIKRSGPGLEPASIDSG